MTTFGKISVVSLSAECKIMNLFFHRYIRLFIFACIIGLV